MQLVMGQLPDPSRRVPSDVEVVAEEQGVGYVRRKIRFTSEPEDRVPAWLLLPKSLGDAPQSSPAMLCLHQTTGIGKDDPAEQCDRLPRGNWDSGVSPLLYAL